MHIHTHVDVCCCCILPSGSPHVHQTHSIIPLRSGLGDATDIVISGCSAGAVQTMINLDYIKSLLPKQAHVVGLPDSG